MTFRVLHIHDVANVAYWLVRGLRKIGVAAEILAPRTFKASSFYMSWLRPQSYIHLVESSSTFGLIKELGEHKDYDIYHAHYCLSPIVACALRNLPFVAHSHGSDLRTVAKKMKYRYFIKLSLKRAEKVLVSTPDLIFHAKHVGVTNPVFFPNPVPDIFKPSKSKIDLLEDRFEYVIFHPSRIVWDLKGTDKLVYAFKKVVERHNARLVLINYGEDLEKTKKLVRELNLTERVLFVDPIPQYTMPEYYNASDIVAAQFNVGHVGLVGLESFACTKPVVADYRFPEYYGELPVLKANTIDEIASQIVKLVENPEMGIELAKRGLNYVERHHALDTVTKRLLDIYREILQ
ncbi:MAG: glycosyltransferase [Candidatus Bathyarchaeia archaeon]